MERVFTTRVIIILALVAIGVGFASCAGPATGSDASSSASPTADAAADASAAGGERLLSFHAEYSYCVTTDLGKPDQDQACQDDLTYQECARADLTRAGEASTFFYTTFTGGESRHPGWNANEYYFVVDYGNDTIISDSHAVFKDRPAEFMEHAIGCYPAATVTAYDDATNASMGSRSFDYATG